VLKIALVTSVFPVPWDLTRGRPVYETARALSELAEVEVFFTTATYPRHKWLRPRGFFDGELPTDYALPGVSMQAFGYPALPMVSRPLNGLVSAALITPRVRAFSPDVVLAYWIYPEGYGALRAARRLGKPCIIGSRGSDIRVRDRVSARFTGIALRGADHVLTVSDELRGQAIERYGANAQSVTTIVNGCNTDLFRLRDRTVVRSGLQIPASASLITFVGRIVEAKGVAELVRSFTVLAQERPELRLALVGDGVYMPTLLRQIEASGLRERVHTPGAVTPTEVAQWISASNLLCLPSHSEGYPNVLVEALASGVPVVATDVGGTREIVDADCGALIAARDEPALQRALGEVLDRRWDAAALSARFGRSWQDVARSTLAVCEQAVAARQPRSV
jgi:teichuronic acid biosynthesis glycosyltransferase TuaC